MKYILAIAALVLVTHFYVGYYTILGVHGGDLVFFIKKYPTLQVQFTNLYTRDSEDVPLDELNIAEANLIKSYCKYRLGVINRLGTDEELEACKAR
ncbi:hypothetical protein [Pseudomonas syringae]|uniref:Uncharacterized protein n=1 Tax=Pseudomonas syringae TaxID=317 RepID=A0A085VN80_PSESX|nr:hypothetical protein [Pseudomonas syringae]KFE56893.1 hypothetical protein IV01_06840 [Pseudomonas syringae]